MDEKYPFYIKSPMILLGLILTAFILSELQDILIPLSLAVLISMILNPLVNKLQNWGFPNLLSIFIAMLIGTIAFLGILYFLSTQINSFSDDLPELKKKFAELSTYVHKSLHDKFGISMQRQDQWMQEFQTDVKPLIGKLMGSMLGTLAITILLPVYTSLLLFYKKLILNFLFEVFEESKAGSISDVLHKTKVAVQNYMIGLLIEGVIVATLNTIALLVLGVKYAILLGVIGAIVNVLPFIGGVLAIIFPVIIATITKDGIQTQILIIASYMIIQFIDN